MREKNSLYNWIPRTGANSLKPTYLSVMSDTLWGKRSTALLAIQSVGEMDSQHVCPHTMAGTARVSEGRPATYGDQGGQEKQINRRLTEYHRDK